MSLAAYCSRAASTNSHELYTSSEFAKCTLSFLDGLIKGAYDSEGHLNFQQLRQASESNFCEAYGIVRRNLEKLSGKKEVGNDEQLRNLTDLLNRAISLEPLFALKLRPDKRVEPLEKLLSDLFIKLFPTKPKTATPIGQFRANLEETKNSLTERFHSLLYDSLCQLRSFVPALDEEKVFFCLRKLQSDAAAKDTRLKAALFLASNDPEFVRHNRDWDLVLSFSPDEVRKLKEKNYDRN